MTSSFDKKNFGEDHSLQEWKFIGIKENGYLDYRKEHTQKKNYKEIQYACE